MLMPSVVAVFLKDEEEVAVRACPQTWERPEAQRCPVRALVHDTSLLAETWARRVSW